MSAEPRPPHAVLVRSPEKFSPQATAAVLAKRAGGHALDFAGSARRAWGLAAESLPAAEADALAADLTAAGQPALAAPASLLETPPPPTLVTKAAFLPDGFEVVEGRANAARERLSWTRLAALGAASIETRQTQAVAGGMDPAEASERAVRLGLTLVTGLPLMKGKAQAKKTVEIRDRAQVLDLLFLEPARRLRVLARDFDYSVLGAGMGYSAELNFLALLTELTKLAPRALRGKGARAMLAKRPAAESLYESLDDLEREERWLVSLAALRAAL